MNGAGLDKIARAVLRFRTPDLVRKMGIVMPEQPNGQPSGRSRLAVAMLKGGLAFGVIWALTLIILAARFAMTLV